MIVILSAAMVLAGCVLLAAYLYHPYHLTVDGHHFEVHTAAFSLRGLLRQLNYEIQEGDRTSVPPQRFSLILPDHLMLQRARLVEIVIGPETLTLQSADLIPANLLQQAGFKLYPADLITQGDQVIDPYSPLPAGQEVRLQVFPAKRVILQMDDHTTLTFYTQKDILGEALLEAEIVLQPQDRLSAPAETILEDENVFNLAKAKALTVAIGGETLTHTSAAATVGEALAEMGLALQNLDRSIPDEAQPLPMDGKISLIQTREQLSFVKDETAFSYTYQLDPNAELDTTSVISPGQLGLVVSRERSRLENGAVVSAMHEGPWKASDPADGVLGTGTKVVIRTEVVDGQTLEYWRKVSVYATSYHPSEFSYGALTRSGMTLTKGVVAVASSWYNGLELQPVYVPGYGHGVIGDSGYGIPGKHWIDLGYDDENYVPWHHWTTIYFLTPVPAYVAAVLP